MHTTEDHLMGALGRIALHYVWFVLVLPFSGGSIFLFGKYMIHTPETGVLVSIASALLGALFGSLLVLVDASITATVWIPLLLFANERVFTIVTIFGFQLVAWYVFLSSRGYDFFREDWVLILAIAFFCAIVTCLVYTRHHFYRLAIKLKE